MDLLKTCIKILKIGQKNYMKITFSFLLITLSISSVQLKEQLKYFGHDILVIINFNHPHYTNIGFLKELYGSVFSNIVFYGPEKAPDVHAIDDYKGWYAYKGIVDAMQRYPHYRGYLWFNDDCALFAWHLLSLDKNRIWSAPPGMGVAQEIWPGIYCLDQDPTQTQWCWWQPNYDALCIVYKKLPAWALHNIEHDYGPGMVVWGNADALYIPQQYRADFIELAQLCAQENLFIEIALPLITACLEHKRNRQFFHILWGLSGDSIPELHEESAFLNFVTRTCFWHETISFCHPIKLSKTNNQRFMQLFYDTMLNPRRTPPANTNISFKNR